MALNNVYNVLNMPHIECMVNIENNNNIVSKYIAVSVTLPITVDDEGRGVTCIY